MTYLPRTAQRLLCQGRISSFRAACTRTGSNAHLHQQGPSRSAVVHEQALPQSQTQPANSPSSFPSPSCTASSPYKDQHPSFETLISHIPLVQALRHGNRPYNETRPHLAIPPSIRQHHLVGGSLSGTGKLAFQPHMWTASFSETSTTNPTTSSEPDTNAAATNQQETLSSSSSDVVSIFHIGRDLCGHPGFVHGGFLSTMFDEVFARCVSAAFPSGLGMTANLTVDFRKPALPDRVYVCRAKTVRAEGRKAWVEGTMTYLPLPVPEPLNASGVVPGAVSLLREDNEGCVMVAEAKALFVEPKLAGSMQSIYRS